MNVCSATSLSKHPRNSNCTVGSILGRSRLVAPTVISPSRYLVTWGTMNCPTLERRDMNEKSFAHSSYLKIHKMTHTGEKKYSCLQCEKYFITFQNLREHQLSHTGEKKYDSSKCDKSFKISQELQSHQRSHNGEKPFACSACEKFFSHSVCLKKHIRTHTDK